MVFIGSAIGPNCQVIVMRYIIVAMFIFSFAAFGAETGDEGIARAFKDSDKGWDKMQKGVLPSKFTSFGNVALDKSTLGEIETLYGTAQRYKSDTTATASDLLCYLSPDGHAVVFESGPLGGGSYVTAILVVGKGIYTHEHCSETNRIEKMPEIGGLAPGLDKAAVERLLGPPSYSDARFIVYRYAAKRPLNNTKTGYFDITSGVEIGISAKGKVSWFQVYWVESS